MNTMHKLFHLVAMAAVAGALLVAPSTARAGGLITVNTTEGTIVEDANCSLPEAVQAANNDGVAVDHCALGSGTDTIHFNVPGAPGLHVIHPAAQIIVNTPVIIDGTTQPDYAGSPVIVVDGNDTVGIGLDFSDQSAGSVVKGLMVIRFTYAQIVAMVGNSTSHVTLTGNYIGTDGSAALGGDRGVLLEGAKYAVIGGPNSTDRNVISGNYVNVLVSDSGDFNNVQGNYIGLDATGTASVSGSSYGVFLQNVFTGASNNTIKGNVISGNAGSGIYIADAGSDNNIIEANYIGTNAAGTAAVSPANHNGITFTGSTNNVIGGTAPGAGNVVSGNDYGISVYGPAAITKILGNRIGTDKDGMAAIPNSQAGIYIGGAVVDVGDAVTPGNNVISGNSASNAAGLRVNGSTAGTTIMGNKIGVNLSGAGALPNYIGIDLYSGGSARIAQNWIAHNVLNSIYIDSTASVASGANLNRANCFISNGTQGLDNEGASLADFRDNWWGAADGPSGSGPGSGDVVWGVNYDLFLTAPAAGCQPTISGNAGVGGATLTYNGGSTIADANGNYSIPVANGWSGTVTPSKAHFAFSPVNMVYSGLTSDQLGQDYTATLTPPTPIAWVSPVHGSDACPTPPVGVDLLLTGMTPSPWTLKLDDVDVTTAALAWELLMNPPRAITMYTPTADLALGVHHAEFDYETAGGPKTLLWNFTVTSIPCLTDSGSTLAPELDEAPAAPSTDSPGPDPRDIDNP